jgi:(S)-ureidoglycine aminohydrolase
MKKVLFASVICQLVSIICFAQSDSLASGTFSFSNAKITINKNGERRDILKGSTLDLTSFQIHTSTLAPKTTNHPPVAYSDKEEIIIVKEGTLTVNINTITKTVSAGSIVLIEAGDTQSFMNNADTMVIYYVISFNPKAGINIARGKENGGSIILDWNELPVKKTDKGASRQVFEKPTTAFSKLSIHVTDLNAGIASHVPHSHRNEEIMLLLKGNGELQVGQTFKQSNKNDIMYLEANVLHAFKNTGTEQCSYYAIQWSY